MVLWISAALAAVAFSLANTVRGETDRTSTEFDEIRGYYLATGAVDRAAVELLWSVTFPEAAQDQQGSTWVDYIFPTGVAHVEFIPETAKLDVNNVPPEQLDAPADGARRGTRPGHARSCGESSPAGAVRRRRFLCLAGSVFSRAAQRLSKR